MTKLHTLARNGSTEEGDVLASRVDVQDAAGRLVSGVSVTVELTQPNGTKRTGRGTTNTSGRAQIPFIVSVHGTYTARVTGMTKSGFTFQPSTTGLDSAAPLVY
jgi:hypothetical protein